MPPKTRAGFWRNTRMAGSWTDSSGRPTSLLARPNQRWEPDLQRFERFERFVRVCAGRVGQILNLSSLGNDAGVAPSTARAWMDLLQSSYIIHLLPPWFTHTGKRLVKSPKLYVFDTGLACW